MARTSASTQAALMVSAYLCPLSGFTDEQPKMQKGARKKLVDGKAINELRSR
jgi:hypothetical protein